MAEENYLLKNKRWKDAKVKVLVYLYLFIIFGHMIHWYSSGSLWFNLWNFPMFYRITKTLITASIDYIKVRRNSQMRQYSIVSNKRKFCNNRTQNFPKRISVQVGKNLQ